MSNTLLPCPFCGGEADIFEASEDSFCALCADCGVETPYQISTEEAIAAWNRRAQSENKPVDVVPVVRGEWVEIGMRPTGTKDTHYCSVCEAHGHKEMNFCPNCGADNRGSEVKQ